MLARKPSKQCDTPSEVLVLPRPLFLLSAGRRKPSSQEVHTGVGGGDEGFRIGDLGGRS